MITALHVIAGIDPKNGGPSYSVPRLCNALRDEGVMAELIALKEEVDQAPQHIELFAQTASGYPVLGRLKLSEPMRAAILERSRAVSILHSHGLWLAPNVYAGRTAAALGKPLVVSPRGMVSREALQFSSLSKKLMWSALQGPAYSRAAAWHATSSEEAEDIRSFGVKAPIAIIPNGIDLPEVRAMHLPGHKSRTLLFLSRIHPKKGLPVLLEAWARVEASRPEWKLIIAGPDEGGHSAELAAQVQRLGLDRVEFLGAIYGSEKDGLLREADLFVLPTLSENFGIAVAEALAAGVPAIVTQGAPWSGLAVNRCGWWIGQGVEALVAALTKATALSPEDRAAMGARGRDWMARDFGWEAIARQMKAVYRWLHATEARPDFVKID